MLSCNIFLALPLFTPSCLFPHNRQNLAVHEPNICGALAEEFQPEPHQLEQHWSADAKNDFLFPCMLENIGRRQHLHIVRAKNDTEHIEETFPRITDLMREIHVPLMIRKQPVHIRNLNECDAAVIQHIINGTDKCFLTVFINMFHDVLTY